MHQASLIDDRPAWLPSALEALARHEFLNARQLAVLCALPVGEVGPALEVLVRDRLVVRLLPASVDSRERVPAYALTRHGVGELSRTSDVPKPRVVNARKSLYMLAHELARNDFGVVLHALDRSGSIRLLRWETSRARIAASVQLVERGRPSRVPLVADALAVVANGHSRSDAFLVEVDRGTVGIARMRAKYAGYLQWWRDRGPERRFGLRSLRVVTLAPNTPRLERLREAAIQASGGRGSGLLWFGEQKLASLQDPARLLEPAWTRATPGSSLEHLFVPLAAAAAA